MSNTKRVLVLFSAVMLALLSSCKYNVFEKKSANIVFDFSSISDKIPAASRSALDDLLNENEACYIDLKIQGRFEYSQTINLNETQVVQIDDIPVGTIITASAELYIITKNTDDESETKEILYKGQSKTYVIGIGENEIEIPLRKYVEKQEENAEGTEEDPNGENGNSSQQAEEQDNSIKIWVVYNSAKQNSDWEANEDPTKDGTTLNSAFFYIQSAIHWIEVNGNGSSNYKIILTGYSATTAFDQPIVYGTNLNYKANSITITSSDPDNFAIKSSSYYSINVETVNCYSPPHLIFKDIKISTNNGVIIYGEANLSDATKITLDNGTVFKGENGNGGAIHLAGGGTIEMRGNSRIETFNTTQGGAAYIRYGSFNMYDTSSIYKCTASDGGAFYFYQRGASATLNNQASIEECEASSDGGAVYMYGGSFTINGGSVKQCHAGSSGGAIFMDTTSGSPTVTLNSGTISNNTATSSGNAIYAKGKNLSAEATINISDDFVIDQSEIYRVN